MSEEINATVSTESTETVDTQGNVDSVQEESTNELSLVLKSVRCYLPNALNGKLSKKPRKTKLRNLPR